MDLVLRGLLVHRVVKVDAVDALKPPVLPEEEGPKAQEDEQRCRERGERGEMLPSAVRPFQLVKVFILHLKQYLPVVKKKKKNLSMSITDL